MPGMPRFGAFPRDDGTCEFRVWAPNSSVSVRAVPVKCQSLVRAVPDTALTLVGDGIHEGVVEDMAGRDYVFVLDGRLALPDPCSRFQPEGIKGPSRVVDTSRYEIAPGPELDREHLVIYELHVGTFSDEGTFAGALPHLDALAELGITAIELMPVATFPGNRGWG